MRIFSAILWQKQMTFEDILFVLEQHAELDFYSANSLKQQSAVGHVTPLRHIILIAMTTSLCSHSLMLFHA
jgi:hypothetical protein